MEKAIQIRLNVRLILKRMSSLHEELVSRLNCRSLEWEDDLLFPSQPSLVFEGFTSLMSSLLTDHLCQVPNALCNCGGKHTPIVCGGAGGHDNVENPDATEYVEFGEEKDVDRVALGRSWVADVVGHSRQAMVEVIADPIGPEPDPINTDCCSQNKSTMRSDLPIVTYSSWTFLLVVHSPISPQAMGAEEVARTELHKDKAVYVS